MTRTSYILMRRWR